MHASLNRLILPLAVPATLIAEYLFVISYGSLDSKLDFNGVIFINTYCT